MTREKAIEILDILPLCNECDSYNFPYTCSECGDAFLLAMEALKQPEVVRCKDCKYYHKPEYGFTYGDCTYCSAWRQVSTDDFCSKGRRKDT